MFNKIITLFSFCFALIYVDLSSQTVSSNPVGFVVHTLNPTADSRIGLSMLRPSSFEGVVSSITNNVVTVSSSLQDITTDAHFVWFNSGALEGKWYSVTDYTASTFTVEENLQAHGLAHGDAFSIVPFWTLDTLFSDSGTVLKSPDPFNPIAFVLLNNPHAIGVNLTPQKAYFYYDGVSKLGPAGWYDANTFEISGDVPVTPESYISIRNTTENPINLKFSGTVPDHILGTNVLSRSQGPQDNLINNPYPADLMFAESNLIASGSMNASPDPFNPTDVLMLFDSELIYYNSTPTKTVFYYDGVSGLGPAGWYNANTLQSADEDLIPAGRAFILRKSSGNDQITTWLPPMPYDL